MAGKPYDGSGLVSGERVWGEYGSEHEIALEMVTRLQRNGYSDVHTNPYTKNICRIHQPASKKLQMSSNVHRNIFNHACAAYSGRKLFHEQQTFSAIEYPNINTPKELEQVGQALITRSERMSSLE